MFYCGASFAYFTHVNGFRYISNGMFSYIVTGVDIVTGIGIPYHTIPYHTIPYHIISYHIIYIISYHIILSNTILYYIIL